EKWGKVAGRNRLYRGLLQSAVIILKPLNIVFTEVCAALDFDEDQRLKSHVLDAMSRAARDIHRAAGIDGDFTAIESHFSRTLYHHPVFGPAFVFLVTQTLVRQDFNAFNLVGVTFVEDRKTSPRTLIKLHAAQYISRRQKTAIGLDSIMAVLRISCPLRGHGREAQARKKETNARTLL